MRVHFQSNSIVVNATLAGPRGAGDFRLLLDTGASMTVLNRSVLRLLGVEQLPRKTTLQLTTANTVVNAPTYLLESLTAFGIQKPEFEIAALELPANANIDGLLGTDFLDDLIVVMNFHRKWVDVRTGNRNDGRNS